MNLCQHNAYDPISKSPDENLMYYLLTNIISVDCAEGRMCIISHVSKTWRDAALDYTNLWTDISFSSPR